MKRGLHDLYSFFGNRCNISRTLIGCHKKNIHISIYDCCTNSTKLSFNTYIYTIQFLDNQIRKDQDILYSFHFSVLFTIIQKILFKIKTITNLKFQPKYQNLTCKLL